MLEDSDNESEPGIVGAIPASPVLKAEDDDEDPLDSFKIPDHPNAVTAYPDPTSYVQAMRTPEASRWKEPMRSIPPMTLGKSALCPLGFMLLAASGCSTPSTRLMIPLIVTRLVLWPRAPPRILDVTTVADNQSGQLFCANYPASETREKYILSAEIEHSDHKESIGTYRFLLIRLLTQSTSKIWPNINLSASNLGNVCNRLLSRSSACFDREVHKNLTSEPRQKG